VPESELGTSTIRHRIGSQTQSLEVSESWKNPGSSAIRHRIGSQNQSQEVREFRKNPGTSTIRHRIGSQNQSLVEVSESRKKSRVKHHQA
jgi:hypothetical protein